MRNNNRVNRKPVQPATRCLRILTWSFMLWLLLAFPTRAQDDGQAALLHLQIKDDHQLEAFIRLGLPVYAHYWELSGAQVLLVEASPETQAQIESLGIPFRLLDPDTRQAAYFMVYTPHPLDPALLPENTRILETTSDFWLLRAAPQEMLALSQSGFEVLRLTLHPLVLGINRPASLITASLTPNPAIQAMIDQVSEATATSYVGDLSGANTVNVNDNPYTFATRYTWAEIPIKKATRFAYEHFINLDMTTYYDTYFLSGVELRHVIAEQPGQADPECIVLLTSHLDSTSNDPYNNAPGADDNASGASGVLLAADILHQYEFACTLRYALFTGEEQVVTYGYFGSKFYAEELAARDENIVAVINLDMIGYNSDKYEIIELHARPDHPSEVTIANLFKNVITAYDINLTTQIITQNILYWSDHVSFWDVGYPAILAMEDYQDLTPYYHLTSDRLGTLDNAYLTDFIRATVGTLAHLAGYIPPPPPTEEVYLPVIFSSE